MQLSLKLSELLLQQSGATDIVRNLASCRFGIFNAAAAVASAQRCGMLVQIS
jgi:hypothetical protein